MAEILQQAGTVAVRDFRVGLPPVYLLVRLASLFKPLPPRARAAAALATTGLGLVGLTALG